jgi:hypothetical protein
VTIKIARFPWVPKRPQASPAVAAEPRGLDAFGSEEVEADGGAVTTATPVVRPASRWRVAMAWAMVLLAGAGAAVASGWVNERRAAATAPPGRLTIQTSPADLDVAIGGQRKGRTPLTLDLPAGTYSVEVGAGAVRRVLTTTVASGSSVVERLEIAVPAVTGTLHVETEPSGLTVTVNGVARGKSPLTIADLPPGDYQIVTGAGPRAQQRRVSVRANETVSAIVSLNDSAASASGWLSIETALPLKILENGKVIGTSDMERVALPPGDHTLDLVSDAFDFTTKRRVSIAGGKVARVVLEVPQGSLSINAQPWADVWLDGRHLGTNSCSATRNWASAGRRWPWAPGCRPGSASTCERSNHARTSHGHFGSLSRRAGLRRQRCRPDTTEPATREGSVFAGILRGRAGRPV